MIISPLWRQAQVDQENGDVMEALLASKYLD